MDGSGNDLTEALLGEVKKENGERRRRGRGDDGGGRNSVSFLRGDFIQRLPEKVRREVDTEGAGLVNHHFSSSSSAKGFFRGNIIISILFFTISLQPKFWKKNNLS